MISLVIQLIGAAIPVIIAITLHEAAHGYAALALGDDTAKQQGRLSLNPLRHVDMFGTIILPLLLISTQVLTLHHVEFLFGWAKPVPVDARRFPNPRRDMALVAAAGPLMNFFLAWVGALLLHPLQWAPPAVFAIGFALLQLFIVANLALGLFNLIPLPPMDGGRIAVGILPLPLAYLWAKIERVGMLIMVTLVFVLPTASELLGHPFDPVAWAAQRVIPNSYDLIQRLAFHDDKTG